MNIDLRDDVVVKHDSSLKPIAYFNGKRIVKDSVDDLYYEIIPFASMKITDVMNMERLTPITQLPKDEQAALRDYLVNKQAWAWKRKNDIEIWKGHM